MLQERGVHTRARHQIADRALVVERRVDGRIRPRIGEVREDALGATALVQVIVNERSLQPPLPSRGNTSATSNF
jgi:hypothetical protein